MIMATKIDWVGICSEELPSVKSQTPLVAWSYKVIWQIYISDTTRPLAINHEKVWCLTMAYKFFQTFKHVVFWDHVTIWKRFICTTTIPQASKISSMVA